MCGSLSQAWSWRPRVELEGRKGFRFLHPALHEVKTMPTPECWDGKLVYNFMKMYGDLYNYEDRLQGDRPPYQFLQYYDGLRIYDRLPAGHCAVDGSCPPAVDLAN